MTRRLTIAPLLALALAGSATAAPNASAGALLAIRGAGFGHGVGLSQYGAYGYARHGYGYRAILAHYYTGTSLARLSGSGGQVRVLLRTAPTLTFRGAASFGGVRLSPAVAYSVSARAGKVELRTPNGRLRASGPAGVSASGPGALTLLGPAANGVSDGAYRGELAFVPAAGGLEAINALGLEDYVRGVIGAEMPSTWAAQALAAQAVAARTYAITTAKPGAFSQFADTRSQEYRGVAAETARTDVAARTTRGQVVTYHGQPATTYFFSTSGGHTENIENSSIGGTAKPWLKGVADPFEARASLYRWTVIQTLDAAQAKLGGLVKGRLRSIVVLKRGVSPRVVKAAIIGTGGRTLVSGATLRSRFALNDTWADFYVISDEGAPRVAPLSRLSLAAGVPSLSAFASSAHAFELVRARALRHGLAGSVAPGRRGGLIEVQARRHGRYVTVAQPMLGPGGGFHASGLRPGRYRVVYRGLAGPTANVR